VQCGAKPQTLTAYAVKMLIQAMYPNSHATFHFLNLMLYIGGTTQKVSWYVTTVCEREIVCKYVIEPVNQRG